MATYFNYFSVRECLKNCSNSEYIECINSGSIDNLLILLQFLDSFREYINCPIIITSSFRNNLHNKRVNGSATSQHMLGEAIDFKCPFLPIATLAAQLRLFLEVSSLERFIGQVFIYETFIHIGLRTASHKTLSIYDKRKLEKPH